MGLAHTKRPKVARRKKKEMMRVENMVTEDVLRLAVWMRGRTGWWSDEESERNMHGFYTVRMAVVEQRCGHCCDAQVERGFDPTRRRSVFATAETTSGDPGDRGSY